MEGSDSYLQGLRTDTRFLTCHLHTIVPMIKSFIKPLDLLQQELCSTCHTRDPVHKNSAKDTEPESWLHKHTQKNTIKNKQTFKYFVILTSLCAKNLSKICLKISFEQLLMNKLQINPGPCSANLYAMRRKPWLSAATPPCTFFIYLPPGICWHLLFFMSARILILHTETVIFILSVIN